MLFSEKSLEEVLVVPGRFELPAPDSKSGMFPGYTKGLLVLSNFFDNRSFLVSILNFSNALLIY